jgi:hypothetical protein
MRIGKDESLRIICLTGMALVLELGQNSSDKIKKVRLTITFNN